MLLSTVPCLLAPLWCQTWDVRKKKNRKANSSVCLNLCVCEKKLHSLPLRLNLSSILNAWVSRGQWYRGQPISHRTLGDIRSHADCLEGTRLGEEKKKTQLSAEPAIFVILPATGCAHTNVSTVPATHPSEQAKRNWNILRGSEISVVCQPSEFIQRDTDVRWRVRGLPLPLKYYKAHCTSHATRFVQSNSLPVEWIADLALPSRVQCFWKFFFFRGETDHRVCWLHITVWLPVALGVGDSRTKE